MSQLQKKYDFDIIHFFINFWMKLFFTNAYMYIFCHEHNLTESWTHLNEWLEKFQKSPEPVVRIEEG